jgi:N-acyl-L-homoserine lactone synthetase
MGGVEAMLLGQRLMAEQGSCLGTNSCYFVSSDSEYANLGRKVEQEVFNEKFGNDSSEMHQEYGAYESRSSFFIILNPTGKPIGVLRVLSGESPEDFKSLYDVRDSRPSDEHPERARIDLEKFRATEGIEDFSTVWDVATVAIPKEHRGPASDYLSTVLHRALYTTARARGIDHFVAVIDKGEYSNLRRLGVPFNPVLGSEPFEYLGSEVSTALHCRVPDVQQSMERKAQEYLKKIWNLEKGVQKPGSRADLYALYVDLIGRIVFGSGVDRTLRF